MNLALGGIGLPCSQAISSTKFAFWTSTSLLRLIRKGSELSGGGVRQMVLAWAVQQATALAWGECLTAAA